MSATDKLPPVNHGTALDAIDFAIDMVDAEDTVIFLLDWRIGDVDTYWPEFREWLADRELDS